MMRTRLLIVSPDVVDQKMAGPGIRCWELARILGETCEVTLALPKAGELSPPGFAVEVYGNNRARLEQLALASDAALIQGLMLDDFPFLARPGLRLIVDLYAPYHLELLSLDQQRSLEETDHANEQYLNSLVKQLIRGDFFICASDRQRDFWTGMLSAVGQVNRQTHSADASLRRLIDVVAFGLPEGEPLHSRQVLKGVFPGIVPDDPVLLWGGGLWDWLDPLTPINAMPEILRAFPAAKLFFLGVRHPAGFMPTMARRATQLAAELGLLERVVIFNEAWTPYVDRANFLLESDVGLSAAGTGVETRYAFRTRLLDYFWARLPIVTTEGDDLSERAASAGVAKVVRPGDARGWASAVIELLDARTRAEPRPKSFEILRQTLTWKRVAEPLTRYCCAPYAAEDRPCSWAEEVEAETAASPAAGLQLQRAVRTQARQIAMLQATMAAQAERLEDIQSGRVMRLLNWLSHRLGK